MEFFVYLLRHLFLRTVLVAKETRALAQGFLIYLGARTYDAGWVPLQFQLVGELTGFYMLEVAEAVARIGPNLQLTVEETRDTAVFHNVGLALQQVLTCLQFHGAQAVLIQVVGVHLLYAEGCIAVTSPAAAEVEFVVDSADAVTARKCQAERIILTIRGVRKLDLSDQRSKEGARSTQSVDTQRIVASVFFGPFLVVYQSRWQGVEVEVAHAVRADNHGSLLLVEGIYYLLECLWRRIEVVAVKLDGKLSAESAVDGFVPASAYSQVGSLRNNLYQVVSFKFIQYFAGAVGRMVVHHDDVELEACLLFQGTLHGISHGLFAVEDGDDDRCLVF